MEAINSCLKVYSTIFKDKNYAVFSNGTCLLIPNSFKTETEYRNYAIKDLKDKGPVITGCERGDFNPIQLKNFPGYLVTYYYENLFNYVEGDSPFQSG
jgi:hypothetical protein